MPIQVDVYISQGVASGVVARSGHLREILDHDGELVLERVRWRSAGDDVARPAADLTIPIDDLLVAVAGEDQAPAVHATWHPIRLLVGPYLVEGEMPTLPGFDPARALTRPTGEFVLLRDVRMARPTADGPVVPVPVGEQALVNRYDVEEVEADLMLGFYFPGATMVGGGSASDGHEPGPASPESGLG
jgi:hypothetical protein